MAKSQASAIKAEDNFDWKAIIIFWQSENIK